MSIILIGFLIFKSQNKPSEIKDPSAANLVTPKELPTPSPNLPQFNQSSNLSEELQKVKPRDFTPDFNNLEKSLGF
ncbi:MAG: hypothetical protein Q7S88_00170 [Candidatus Daviesbacteria bacterium]|nr:hypothetical protein [Candidatus Daviesbacteria bacterium]